jgi:hypothetical protein
MTDIKMIATDLDGTFFGPNYSIPEENLKAVKVAREAGIVVCGCSARLWGMGRAMMQKGGFDGYGVFNNGAAVAVVETGEIYDRVGISPIHFKPLIEAAVTYGMPVQCWNHEFIAFYGPTLGERGKMTLQRFSDPNAEVYCEARVYDNVDDMDRDCRDVAQKIMIGFEAENVPRVAAHLKRICDVEVSSSNPMVVEITMPGATKGLGLAKLAKIYGVAPENVMAIGDSHNDIGMLEFAGTRVAVANAEEELKRVAQYVVGKNVDGGFAQAVYEFAMKA